MEREYAAVIERLLSKGTGEDVVVKNLVAHLTKVGRMKLLPMILRELKVSAARAKSLGARVEVAKKEGAKTALAGARALGIEAEEATVNPNLLSGWRARKQGTLVDRSGKRALTDIYQAIVKA